MSPFGASSFTTSAPSQARIWVADGPDWTWVMSRTRIPSSALISCPRSLVHRLVHGSRRVHLGIDPHVDERGQTRFPRALQCGRDVGRVAHFLAVPAEHLRELVVLHVAERVTDAAAGLAVLLDLPVADLVHRRVVADDSDEREVEAHQRLEVPAGEAEGSVAEERDDLLVRAGVLGGEYEGDADAERAQRAWVHPVAGGLGLHDL